ncbi:TPA: hypothetical protein KEY88_003440 [Serratia marcescens]|nr:hypothetical protein [Serratia marcescens]
MKRFKIHSEVNVDGCTQRIISVINGDSAERAIVIAENQLSDIGFAIINHIGVKECSDEAAAELRDNVRFTFTVKPEKDYDDEK